MTVAPGVRRRERLFYHAVQPKWCLMKRRSTRPCTPLAASVLAFVTCLTLLTAIGAQAATPAAAPNAAANQAAALSPADAQQLLAVLNDPAKLAALKTTLGNLQKAVAATAAAKPPLGLPQNSLGAQVVESLDTLSGGLAAQGRDLSQTLHEFGEARPWLRGILADPLQRSQIAAALVRLVVVLGAAFGVSALLDAAIKRPVSALARLAGSRMAPRRDQTGAGDPAIAGNGRPAMSVETPAETIDERHMRARHKVDFARLLHALQLLPMAIAHFMLELVPIAGFALVAFLFEIGGLLQTAQDLVIVQSAVGAFVIGGGIIALIYGLFAPERPALRLILVRDVVAKRISFWLWLMVLIGASGFAILNVLQKLGLPDYAGSIAVKLLLLVEHTLLAVLIFRSRFDIVKSLQPREHHPSLILLRALVRNIWIVAVFFDFALWLIWAAQLKNGYTRLLTSTAETALVLVAARLLTIAMFGGLERMLRAPPEAVARPPAVGRAWAARAAHYYPLGRRFAVTVVFIAAIVAVLQAWGVSTFHWFRAGAVGGRLLSALAGAMCAIVAGIITWEAANIALDSRVERLRHDPAGGAARVARLQTLMPILRIILFIFIAVVLVMTVLSEIGVNIAPLLGGAGIVGVAIGFGSQKLVQDFITGIFLLLENAMQVGDAVTCAGLSGAVEHLSIRTLHLRAGDGSLQIIPFSSVTTITNSNRGLGNAAVAVDIAPQEDPDQVADILKNIVTDMRADPQFGAGMLSDLQYWGVDKVSTQAVTLVGQVVCTDAARWDVQREFNRRMRNVFAERGIGLAQPVQTVQLLQPAETPDGAAGTPPAEGRERPSAVVKESPPPSALGHTA